MRTLSIADAKALEPGEIIPSIRGIITKIRPTKAGSGQHGPWTVQNIKLKDATGEVGMAIWNRSDDFTEGDIGREVIISSFKTEKHGLQGVSRDNNEEYNGKSYPKLKTTKTADFKFADEAGEQDDGDLGPVTQPAAKAPSRPQDAPRQEKAPTDPQAALAAYKRALGASETALGLCFEAAGRVLEKANEHYASVGVEPGFDDLRSLAIHLAISLEKRYLADNLPAPEAPKPLPASPPPAIQRPRQQNPPPEPPEDPDEPPF